MPCVIEGTLLGLVDVDVTPEVCAARLDGVCDSLSCVLEVERAGDVNHDGYDDPAVSTNRTPGETYTDGAVMLFLGPLVGDVGPDDAAFSLRPEERTEEFPTQLGADASLGDVDGKGVGRAGDGSRLRLADGPGGWSESLHPKTEHTRFINQPISHVS